MVKRLIANGMKDQKLLSISTVIFMAVSSMLIALALTLFTNLTGSVGGLMEAARTPDFLQMHAGELREEELNDFAQSHTEIEEWQICRFLNLDNHSISLGNESLAGNTQDNGLCIQGKNFDYLLDMDNKLPEVTKGQVFVPVCYRSIYHLTEGDKMYIGGDELVIAGFLRDAQMNSMMASSKRFLVCKEDYDRLFCRGSEEYLIEYRLLRDADLDAFASAYSDANLPANGPAITRGLIKMMNALSDGIMIFVILLVGIAILMISLLCIGYITSLGVERDRSESGLLKALGIPKKQILQIYMAKYRLFSVIGGTVGLFGAFLLSNPLGKSLKELYGTSENLFLSVLAAMAISILVQLLILFSIRRIIRKDEKITAVKALFHNLSSKQTSGKRQTIIIGSVTVLCVMLTLIPQNLYSTLASPEFVSYMGIGNAQLRMDVRLSENIASKTQNLVDALEEDKEIQKFVALKTASYPIRVNDNEKIHLLVEVGDHGVFPVTYTEGRQPQKDDEIALSVLQAKDLELGMGDAVIFDIDGAQAQVVVCGLYSDITNGGKTAKMCTAPGNGDDKEILWSVAYVTLKDLASSEEWLRRYEDYDAEVVDIEEYVNATFEPTIRQISNARVVALSLATMIEFVVILLFVCLLIEKNRNEISLQKALGFRSKVLIRQYMKKAFFPILMGIIVGTLAAVLLGEKICGLALSSLGASGFKFVIRVPSVIEITGIFFMAGLVSMLMGTGEIRKIAAYECCRGKE